MRQAGLPALAGDVLVRHGLAGGKQHALGLDRVIADKDRQDRAKKWEDWVKAVAEKTQQVGLPTQPGGDNSGKFQRGGSGGTGGGSPDGGS